MQGIGDQRQTAGDHAADHLRQRQQHIDGNGNTQAPVSQAVNIVMRVIVPHRSVYTVFPYIESSSTQI